MNCLGVGYRISYYQCHLITEDIRDAAIEAYGRLVRIVPGELPHRDILALHHKYLSSLSMRSKWAYTRVVSAAGPAAFETSTV